MGVITRFRRVLVFFALVVLTAHGAAAKDFKVDFRPSLVSEYTDNLYHLSEEELQEFYELQAPGEQFFGMESPEDVETRIRLRTDLSWKLAKKRYLELVIRATYYTYARNTKSDYPRLDIGLGGDMTRKDKLYGGVDLVYDRFWKNYQVANSNSFAPAVYSQAVGRFGYAREITKRWSAGVEYQHQRREYDPPFESRDRDGNYLAGFTSYRMAKGVRGETLLHYGDVETPTEIDNGIPENRSYTEWLLSQDTRFKLSKKVGLNVLLQYRQRDATTPFTQDLARYNRTDRRYRGFVALVWEAVKNLDVQFRARYTQNDSDRIDPTIITDEVGYNETNFGIGIRYKF